MKNFVFFLSFLLMTMSVCAQERTVAVCAHRGYWKCGDVPNEENSIASLRMAQEYGFWGSEFDVHLTVDSVVVVHHDEHKGGLSIHRNTYARLAEKPLSNGETLPTVEDYLDQGMQSPCMLVMEFKYQASRERADVLVDRCVAALRERGLFTPERVMFISFDLEICKRMAADYPAFTHQYLSGDKSPDELHALGINGMDYQYMVFHHHPEWVARAHELGMSVNVWTVDSPDEMRRMVDLGVDCITTNEPLRLRDLLQDF